MLKAADAPRIGQVLGEPYIVGRPREARRRRFSPHKPGLFSGGVLPRPRNRAVPMLWCSEPWWGCGRSSHGAAARLRRVEPCRSDRGPSETLRAHPCRSDTFPNDTFRWAISATHACRVLTGQVRRFGNPWKRQRQSPTEHVIHYNETAFRWVVSLGPGSERHLEPAI
jgi:hypothetical protein